MTKEVANFVVKKKEAHATFKRMESTRPLRNIEKGGKNSNK